ncbi:BamA/TamA family outer membrane protein [Hymenobacter properus]|uniref:Bacterial surface antigen (D15) domain-containing protein n=1 Tax=Hymenobacter properus TaxID=2791026 RepID=A0A931BGP0_9BACT|nr:hypothetical protein [Hymenobacter properus]MBF9143619.1 hypothetical protein [Hymenobacter properus]MBR7722432.1 hypothetical protein [Microvirga sp. SRT04]
MSFRGWFLLLFVLLSSATRPAGAQTFDPRSAIPPDSLKAADEILPYRPDSLRRRFDEERILNRLKAYSRRKTIMGKALSSLLNFTQRQEEQAGLDAVLLNRQFDQHNFKIVRRINIRTLDAFGYSLSDSTRIPRSFWEKSGNALHLKTARSRVRQVLLFRPGQPLEPQALAESERLLRQTPEILDARVLVNERSSTRDSVDITVLTTDVFSITAGAELGSATAGLITLGDENFLGLGHQLSNEYRYGRGLSTDNGENPQQWSYVGSYTAPFRNFVYGQARYRNEYNYRSGGASLRRDFYSPSARYAGAISFDSYDQNIALVVPPPGQPYVYYPLRSLVQDVWVGRSLRLRSYDLGYENPGRVIVAARALRTEFSAVPRPDPGTGIETPDYHNGTLLLGTVGYSVRRYYKDRYLFGFGRTEDVPAGTLLSFTAGVDVNRVVPRRYLAGRIAAAGFGPRSGYLYGALDLGIFQRLDQGRSWEQGVLSTEFTSFTRLYHVGNWQYRHFLSSRGTIGIDRRPGDLLQGITNDRGLRGFSPASPVLATSRFVLNYETTLFTPLSLLGFRLAGVAFADAAWVSDRPGGGSPFGGAPYTGFGLGLRFRNEFTALRTFQLLIGYYPRGIAAPNGIRMFESTRETVTFTDFGLGAPGTAPYQ